MTTEPEHWWAYGGYTGDNCPHCGRLRLMKCEDNDGKDRVICEKCYWEPEANGYCQDISE